jgi:hypothetical protein
MVDRCILENPNIFEYIHSIFNCIISILQYIYNKFNIFEHIYNIFHCISRMFQCFLVYLQRISTSLPTL